MLNLVERKETARLLKVKPPQMLDEALQTAVTVFEAVGQEKRIENFYANSEKHRVHHSASSGKFGHPDQQSRIGMRTGSKLKYTIK